MGIQIPLWRSSSLAAFLLVPLRLPLHLAQQGFAVTKVSITRMLLACVA